MRGYRKLFDIQGIDTKTRWYALEQPAGSSGSIIYTTNIKSIPDLMRRTETYLSDQELTEVDIPSESFVGLQLSPVYLFR